MRDYSKVSSAFWTGKTGKSLRGNQQAQVVALYLMTCPHANMVGVFHCPIIYIAHETGSTIEGATKGLNDLIDGAFCTYDHDSETVWVHEMAKYQIGENLSPNDKQVIGIKKQFQNLPESLIKQGFYDRYKTDYQLEKTTKNSKPLASPSEAPSKPEAEAEAELSNTNVLLVSNEVANCPHDEIIKLYAKHLPMLTQIKVWSDARAKNLKTRWREDTKRQNLDYWDRFFGYIAKSDFLTGRNGQWLNCNLAWLVKSENFIKVLEGNYQNKEVGNG